MNLIIIIIIISMINVEWNFWLVGFDWQVIQRRDDYGEDRENFNRDWDDYKSGFGNPDGEFWLGNENIYMLTNAEDYSLRVELEDFEGNIRYYNTIIIHHHFFFIYKSLCIDSLSQ